MATVGALSRRKRFCMRFVDPDLGPLPDMCAPGSRVLHPVLQSVLHWGNNQISRPHVMPENGAIQPTVLGRGCGISCAGVHIQIS